MSALVILIIVFVSIFVLFAIGVYRCTGQYSIQRRIEELKAGPEVETLEEEMKKPFAQRVILPMAERLASRIRSLLPQMATTTAREKLIMAGMYPGMNEMHFLGICWLMGFLFMFLSIFVTSSLFLIGAVAQVVVAIATFVAGFLFPKVMLNGQIQKRQAEIIVAFPYVLDLLAICVEAGLGFDAALGYVMKKTHGPLADEFAKTLNEIRLGKPRMEALIDLGRRIGVEDVRSFITAIVHVYKMGGSITNSLHIQADMVRVKRRHRAQEQVMKAPIKIVFPLVFCVFPALFVVVLGPAVIAIVRELYGKM
ncbi:MAG: type II secretion system F family protein [Verrucomicrobiae bacterium]|nr:type II secretion system F family protein [Verrucomicrobiae bacterium]